MAGKPATLRAMLAADGRRLNGDQRDAAYGRGCLLTYYLMVEPRRRGQLIAYLAAVGRGTPGAKAAEAGFGDRATLDRELDAYMRRPRMSYIGSIWLRCPTMASPSARCRRARRR